MVMGRIFKCSGNISAVVKQVFMVLVIRPVFCFELKNCLLRREEGEIALSDKGAERLREEPACGLLLWLIEKANAKGL